MCDVICAIPLICSFIAQIKEYDADVVSKMIEYIYTDDLKHAEDYNSIDLMLLADKYNIVGLRRKCEKALSKNLNIGSVFYLPIKFVLTLGP